MDKFTLLSNYELNWRIYSPEYFNFVKDYYAASLYFLEYPQGVLPLASYKQGKVLTVGTLPKTDALLPALIQPGITYQEIVAFLKKQFPRHQSINLRFIFPFDQENRLPLGLAKTSVYHAIATINKEDVLSFFDKKTRNQVRQSIQNDFELKTDTPLDLLYPLYLENMRRHGTPPKPRRYFESLQKNLGDKIVFLSAYQGAVLSGVNIFYHNGDYLLLLHNISDQRHWSLRVNNFLYLKTIEYGRSRGVVYFDYGPSTEKDRSHLDFKIGFGGKLLPVYESVYYRSWKDKLTLVVGHKVRNVKMRISKWFK